MRKTRNPIISIYFKNLDYDGEEQTSFKDSEVDPNDLRSSEKELVEIGSTSGTFHGIAIYDLRKDTKLQAGLAIGTTLFVCIALAYGALLFSQEANNLVIVPIEQMIKKIHRITLNPLVAA